MNIMRKRMCIMHGVMAILMAMVICVNMIPIQAYAEETSQRELVKVGYFPFAGYHMVDEKGMRTGYGYDILQQMLLYENWEYEYVGYEEDISWDDAQNMLEQGEIDLLTSATMSEERLELYDYSDIPIGTSSTILTVRAGDNRFDTEDYTTWNGLCVGMLTGNSRNNSFDKYAREHGFTYQRFEYDSPDALQQDLKAGKLDMIVTSNLLSLSDVIQVDKFDEKPFYVIVKKGNTKLLNQVNDALEHVLEKDRDFADALYVNYYEPQSSGIVTFTREEQAFVENCQRNGKVFTAVINPDRKPIGYYSDGEAKGLLVDIAKTIFDRTGLTIQFQLVDNRDEYLAAIRNREVDVIADYTGSSAKAEESGYVATDVYYTSSFSKLVKKGSNVQGTTCALVKSSTSNSILEKQPGATYVYYDTVEECRDAVKNGQVDFTYGYTRILQEAVYADVTNSFMCVPAPNVTIDIKMAVNLQDSNLFSSVLNKGINSITENDINALSDPYSYYDRNDKSLMGMVYDQPILLIIIIILLLLTVFAIVFAVVGKKRHEKEQALNEKLKTANEAKSALLSRVSHDMRTPLNGILGINGLLLGKEENSEKKMDLEQIQIAGVYLLNLVNDMLDVSRIEKGKLELHPDVYDGHAILENAVALLQPSLDAKHIHFALYHKEVLDGLFYMDHARFEQVFMNICSNAVKFTRDGGNISITIHMDRDDGDSFMTRFTVKDSGIGMSKEFIEHIFEPFSQADSSKKNPNQGTGLGMTIVKELVNLMGGEIYIESEPGTGTSVSFTLPIQRATQEQAEQYEQRVKMEKTNVDLGGKHVLLCEDHPLNANIAKRLIEKAGGIVTWAKDGKEGSDLFIQSSCNEYDVILMDIRMPVMDGLEAASVIRNSSHVRAKEIPIIAMSANAYEEDVQKSLDAGMNGHLAKPVEPALLYQMLVKVLEEK